MARRRENTRLVYSTNPLELESAATEAGSPETRAPQQQKLQVLLDCKGRKGKAVTLVRGFVGSGEALKTLTRTLQSYCGVGGSSKNGEILLQGDFRDRVVDFLSARGYSVKKVGG